jgi:hypothetical protein
MPQVRILYADGTRDDIDVESEDSVTATVVAGRICVFADETGPGGMFEVLDTPVEEVAAVMTTSWSEGDGEVEMEETIIWSSRDA